VYDGVNGYSCRYNQQNLQNISTLRPLDVCDYREGFHWKLNDTKPTAKCAGSLPLERPIPNVRWPVEFINSKRFIGVDQVNQIQCNHWLAGRVNISGQAVQMDVWTAQSTGYPCQIHISPVGSKQHTTWAFDGFAGFITGQAVDACGAGKIMCTEADYICRAKTDANTQALTQALEWVCDPSRIDCSPISPGGDHFEPDDIHSHASWAFNAYYLVHRETQGAGACNFGGVAELVKPNTPSSAVVTELFSRDSPIFFEDLVCP